MKQPGQPGADRRPQDLRASFRALLCLLLVLFGSTVQAAHTHGKLLPASQTEISAHGDGQVFLAEDLCPLCAAMHAVFAPPAAPLLQVATEEIVLPEARPRSLQAQVWSFELFGRPPPRL